MMKHKILLLPVILAAVIACAAVFVLCGQSDSDNYSVSEQEVALMKANLAATGKTMTDAEIIDTLKRRQTIFAEAERLGISVSLDEARQYLEDMFTLINDNLDSESEAERTSAGQTMALMQQYMDGLDMTQQEYIELAAPLVQKILSGNALLQYFRSTLDEETAADKDKLTELYNEYVDGLMTDK
ncbi:MAG: hypothetical protein IJB55_02570 [Firmicutes bacterium]|nr:hypothetical protein [Bacillota bacterium]